MKIVMKNEKRRDGRDFDQKSYSRLFNCHKLVTV